MKTLLLFTAISLATIVVPTVDAASVTFSALPANGSIAGSPSSVVGWGYSLINDTEHYLLPIGLSNSGVVYGNLEDIFGYPVLDPGQTVAQQYVFNDPGGFGNSLGLFEYLVPADVPAGLVQNGTFSLMYLLFDDNPDLNPSANAIDHRRLWLLRSLPRTSRPFLSRRPSAC
jgi:hypothetical protein